MRATLCVAALILFILSFGVMFIFFREADPHVKAFVGAGLFVLPSVLLLWDDLIRSARRDRREAPRLH